MTEQPPPQDALDAATEVIKAVDDAYSGPSWHDIGYALDRFAKQRVSAETATLRDAVEFALRWIDGAPQYRAVSNDDRTAAVKALRAALDGAPAERAERVCEQAVSAERERLAEAVRAATPDRARVLVESIIARAMHETAERPVPPINIQRRDPKDEIARLNKILDIHEKMMHPWYGPCDGFGPEEQCAECLRVLGRDPFAERPVPEGPQQRSEADQLREALCKLQGDYNAVVSALQEVMRYYPTSQDAFPKYAELVKLDSSAPSDLASTGEQPGYGDGLLPCPFCGSTDLHQIYEDTGRKWGCIACFGCGAKGGAVKTWYDPEEEWRADAAAQWNRRASTGEQPEDGIQIRARVARSHAMSAKIRSDSYVSPEKRMLPHTDRLMKARAESMGGIPASQWSDPPEARVALLLTALDEANNEMLRQAAYANRFNDELAAMSSTGEQPDCKTGFFATLTPEQQKAALEYRGPDWHGPEDTRMVVVFREDLDLPLGKLAVQAGHAFLTAFWISAQTDAVAAQTYIERSQTKLAMLAPDLAALERIKDKAQVRGVPFALITDAGRTVLPEPTVTALGLGPMTKTDSNALTRGLKLLLPPTDAGGLKREAAFSAALDRREAVIRDVKAERDAALAKCQEQRHRAQDAEAANMALLARLREPDPALVDAVAKAAWERTHDGEWPHDAEPATEEIYRGDARTALAVITEKLT